MPGQAETRASSPVGNPYLAIALAWLLPGGGHLYLRRFKRAMAFLALVLAALLIGFELEGRLPWTFSGSPLAVLATLGSLGSGAPLVFLRFGLDYQGTVAAPGYEYGGAFILTAGLMNLLLVLDAWDIATGRKA